MKACIRKCEKRGCVFKEGDELAIRGGVLFFLADGGH